MQSITDDWRVSCHNMNGRLKYVLDTGLMSDCTFILGTGENETHIKAHKVILGMASPVLYTMLFKSDKNPCDTITISDIETDVFNALLRFIYTEYITIESLDMAYKLSEIGSRFVLQRLIEACSDYVDANINKNSCIAYEFGVHYNIQYIKTKAMRYIQENTKKIFAMNTFNDIALKTLCDILNQDVLNIDSELDLLNAVGSYYKHLKNKDTYLPDESNTMIRDAIKNIRFLTLLPSQFIDATDNTDLLTQQEVLLILKKISSSESDVPMPEGFSTSIKKRNDHQQSVYLYCKRPVSMESIWECSGILSRLTNSQTSRLSFKVNRNVILLGIQIPGKNGYLLKNNTYIENFTLSLRSRTGGNNKLSESTESLTFYHDKLNDIYFDIPCIIQENEVYQIEVGLHNSGNYRLPPATGTASVKMSEITFDFEIKEKYDLRPGFIQSLIYCTTSAKSPKEDSKKMTVL